MKKTFLAIIITVMFSAGFTSKTQAQTKAVNIENLKTENVSAKTPHILTETPYYNKTGKLLYTVKRYNAFALPKEISRMIKNQFYDFDITGVEEIVIAANNNSIYFVHIASDKKLKTVKVYNGESEVVNEYTKG